MTTTDDPTIGTADDVLVSLFTDSTVRADPYPAYRRLREIAPVHRSAVLPLWVATRYDDCGTVEEMLRYEGPVQLDARTALEDADLAGSHIDAGQVVVMLLGAANRDPDRYPDPDRFDITRTGTQHLSFAAGIHYCLGAPLARLEGEVVFERLLARFPTIGGDTAPVWRSSLTLRGLETLEVSVR